jgi:hypothetical protein
LEDALSGIAALPGEVAAALGIGHPALRTQEVSKAEDDKTVAAER